MIRHQDLIRELKELVQQLPKKTTSGDEASSSNQNRIRLQQQQCQTVMQHHEAWLASILTTSKNQNENNGNSNEENLKEALQQIRVQLWLQQGGEQAYAQVVHATREGTPSSSSSSSSITMTILRAYALYQLQEYDQVLDLFGDTSSQFEQHSALAALHLQAQSYYHLQDYEGAMEMYATILEQLEDTNDNEGDDDVHEIYVNYMAAYLNQYSLPYCPESKKNKVTHNEDDNILTDLLAIVEQQQPSATEEETEETVLDLRYNVATYQLMHRSNAREAKLFLQSRRANDRNCSNQYEWSQHYWNANNSMKGMRFQTKDTATSKNMQTTKDLWLLLQYYHDEYETLDDLPQNNIKWTLLQNRLFDYNRCVALLHQKHYDDCRVAIEELWESMAPEKAPEKDDLSLNDPVLLWWEVRLAVLLLYCPESSTSNNDKKKKKTTTSLELRSVRALEFALMSIAESPFRDHTLVYLQLHQAVAEEQFQQQPSLEELYAEWPPALRTKPAVQATMVALQQSEPSEQKQPNGKSSTKETVLLQGHWHSNQGHHQAAAECYEVALSQAKDSEMKQMIQARLVQALTHVDPDRAMKLWDDMSSHLTTTADVNDYDFNVQAMEALEKSTQRWNHANKAVSQDTDVMQSITTAVNMETTADTTKKSRDAVLKQRARRRARYLDQLQKKGLYNPERPTQPDPERWIPKYDRAANRRRKKNHAPAQNKHQGTGTISEKDLARLDVAARQQQPKNLVSSTPSTAHMSASGARKGGKRR